MSMNVPQITDTGTVPVGFTGIIYNDVGRMNYAAALGGKLLRRKDGKVRWFRYAMEAERALYFAEQKQGA